MYKLSSTLVSRLMLNPREQNSALAGLSTTIETQGKFQAALPTAGMTRSTSVMPSVWEDNSPFETAPSMAVGGSCQPLAQMETSTGRAGGSGVNDDPSARSRMFDGYAVSMIGTVT